MGKFLLKESHGSMLSPSLNAKSCPNPKSLPLVSFTDRNKQYRRNVDSMKEEYVQSKRARKTAICKELVDRWYAMDPPGRFIEKDSEGLWNEIGEIRARKKTSQLLREDAPSIRDEVKAKASKKAGNKKISGTKRSRSRTKTPKIDKSTSKSPEGDPWLTAHIEPVVGKLRCFRNQNISM